MTTKTPTAVELADAVRRIKELEALAKPIQEEIAELKTLVKTAIEETRDPVVAEPYVATLRERNRSAEVDIISAAQRPEVGEHIVRAAAMGLLSVRLTALKAQLGKAQCADVLMRYLSPGGVTTELRIERAD